MCQSNGKIAWKSHGYRKEIVRKIESNAFRKGAQRKMHRRCFMGKPPEEGRDENAWKKH